MYDVNTTCLLLLLLGVYCVAGIFNGGDADPHEYPFMVRVQAYGSHYCGGSLIRPNIVLTSAYCVEENVSYSVVVGDHVDGETELHERVVNVSKKIMHEEYAWLVAGPFNDVALLVLAENVELKENVIETIALARNEEFYEEGTSVTVIGWGDQFVVDDTHYFLASVLQELEYKVADQAACHDFWEQFAELDVSEALVGQVCTIDPEQESTAMHGDLGGPLFVKNGEKYQQIGIFSWGLPFEFGIGYNMFANTYHYLDWIEEKIASADENETILD